MKIFKAVEMNWTLHCSDDWDRTEYIVYDNGMLEQFVYIGTDAPTMKTSITQMQPELLKKFRALLDEFTTLKPQEDVPTCDGIGWILTTYGAHGKILHRFNGSIYGMKLLKDITEFLP